MPIDSQTRYILTQHAPRLQAEGYTQERFMAVLSKLAAATWKAQDGEPVAIDAEGAAASVSPGEGLQAFLELCIDCGFLVRGNSGLRFRDAWLHGYLAARGLVHLLGDEYSDRGLTRENAARLLVKIGSPAIPVMILALAVEDDSMGFGAAVVLREIGLAAVPASIEALSFGNQRVRRWATSALSSKENANAALPELVRVVEQDDRPLVVAWAVSALGTSQNPEAEPALIAALRHEHPMVQMLSKKALGDFDSPRARRALDDLSRPVPGVAPYAGTRSELQPAEREKSREPVSISNSPRVFISYAKEDVRYADELRRLLKLADFDPWLDSAGLLAGEAWEARLVEALRTSDFVVALLSEHTAGGYQDKELRLAVENAPSRRKPDVPFVLPCAIGRLPKGDAEAAIPDFLDKNQLIRIWDFERNWRQVHEVLYKGARAAGLAAPRLLRSKPRGDFDESAANQMIIGRNFFDSSRNQNGRPAATTLQPLLDGDLVADRATGRVWTRSCFAAPQSVGQTRGQMIAWKANQERLGGASDWRIPTLEEAMSLMQVRMNQGLYLSSLFSEDEYVLTCDGISYAEGGSFVWVACYGLGDCQTVPADAPATVRLVRTDWEYLQ